VNGAVPLLPMPAFMGCTERRVSLFALAIIVSISTYFTAKDTRLLEI
jgi:hypothetical protein